jgi:hypothetical protein
MGIIENYHYKDDEELENIIELMKNHGDYS